MNENLDLIKILDGCPEGTKFYSSIFGEVSFVETQNYYNKYPIKLQAYNKSTHSMVEINYAEDDRSSYVFDGECTLFPSKDQRDWSKFKRFWDKPKVERFDVNTLHPFVKILARDHRDELWSIDLFSHKTGNIVRGLLSNWCYVIPFNEETKYLVGTRDDCPEYYKWWEE